MENNSLCVVCNATLPDRFKGRERLYCSMFCKKVARGMINYTEVALVIVK